MSIRDKWRAWRLQRAELALADLEHYIDKWGWTETPSERHRTNRRRARGAARVAALQTDDKPGAHHMNRTTTIPALAAVFLAAVVAANLIIADQGPSAAPYVAFGLIALDLVIRDALHDRLRGRDLALLMGALVLTGAGLAYLASPDAGRIAEASALAFAAGLTADTLVYHAARRLPWLERSSVSNIAGAAVDTVVFFTVAFDTLDGSFAQWTAKVAGALVFVLIFAEHRRARSA